MVNKILDAITVQLGKTFGTNYHYYVEDVKQALKTPCFTIDMIQPWERSRSPILYDRTMPIVIHYFHDDKTTLKKSSYNIAERAMECLEYLSVDNVVIRGEDLSWHIVDGVLQMFVTYRFTTRKDVISESPMVDLAETKVKNF